MDIKQIIEAHRFFVRKTPHYLNGNWNCYKPLTWKQRMYYPVAYIKFMYYELRDTLTTTQEG